MKKRQEPGVWEAFIPIAAMLPLLGFNVWMFGDNALSGYNQFALLAASAIAAMLGWRRGITWGYMEQSVVKTVSSVVPALFILLLIGSLSGSWMLSGVIPAFIYYGIDILHPSVFLPACCLSCALISMATGSSWTTIATIGVALMGIGTAMGFHQGMVAGAIISGAYFGDKMSPLSETTNMASAVTDTPLFTHIRYMTITTLPAMGISLILYTLLGMYEYTAPSVAHLTELQQQIGARFHISLYAFIIPAVVIWLIVRKVSPIPALFVGTLLGMAGAMLMQNDLLSALCAEQQSSKLALVFGSAVTDMNSAAPNSPLSGLLAGRGMGGMLNTVWLILCAMCFGGIMEATGALKKIAETFIKGVHHTAGAVASTVGTCVLFNITASDQYLSIVVPGRMFKPAFERLKLSSQNLSRSLEDGGTVTSVLVPWNTCGATQATVLGVATLTYLPWCFFNFLCPIMSIAVAFFNFRISKLPP
jgi:NhaC family Na+:H+ antiporter